MERINIELRSTPSYLSNVRIGGKSGEGRTVTGYALVFNEYSQDLGGFREIIKPSALSGVLDRSDVMALMNHDIKRGLLARSTNMKGSLILSVDRKGLKYTFEAPNYQLGTELLEGVKRGDIRSSSFSFAVTKEGQQWQKQGNEYIRTITQFDQIFDVSPVYKPAYLSTDVAVRSFTEYMNEQRNLEEIRLKEVRQAELVKEWSKYDKQIDEMYKRSGYNRPIENNPVSMYRSAKFNMNGWY